MKWYGTVIGVLNLLLHVPYHTRDNVTALVEKEASSDIEVDWILLDDITFQLSSTNNGGATLYIKNVKPTSIRFLYPALKDEKNKLLNFMLIYKEHFKIFLIRYHQEQAGCLSHTFIIMWESHCR